MATVTSIHPIALFLVALSGLPLGWAQGQCYYPGGERAFDQLPCDAFAYTTMCCPFGWTCFSNSVCIATDMAAVEEPLGTTIRGTCTNPLWNNGACGDYCLNDPDAESSGAIEPCGDGNWCCAYAVTDGSCDCESGNGTFSIPAGVAQTIIGVEGLGATMTTTPSSSTASSTTSTSISSTLTLSAVTPTISSSASSSTPTTKRGGTAGVEPSSTGERASPESSGSSDSISITQTTGFKVGVSVGAVAFVLVVLSIAGFFVWRKRQNRKKEHLFMANDSSSLDIPMPNINARFEPAPVRHTPSRDSHHHLDDLEVAHGRQAPPQRPEPQPQPHLGRDTTSDAPDRENTPFPDPYEVPSLSAFSSVPRLQPYEGT